ncbi:MAG: oligosaccharide flippase family protein, partial [Clostridia bacterium]|nr:oligosaccharide flippase family protein [Clostridia bacterium]
MNKTAKSFGIVTGFAILTRAIAFIFKIWMSRALGAEIVGLYQIAMSVLMMLFTITSGAPTVLSRKVAEAASMGDTKRQNSLTTASLLMGFAISAVLCGLLFGMHSKLGFLFSDERCLPIFLIMLPTLVTSTLYASFRSWFWGRKNFLAFSSTELLDEIVKIILSVVFAGGLVAFISGAQGIALAMTLSDALCVVVLAILYFISGGRLAKPRGFKELISRTVPLSATRIITSLATSLTAIVIPQMLVKYGMTVSAATAEYGRVAGMALPL